MFAFGDAGYFGSAGAAHLGSSAVAMAVAPGGHGYWLATTKGAILRFGDVGIGAARVTGLGSAVVDMVATPDAKGYWLVTGRGQVLAYGDAHYYGSMDGARLNGTVVGIAPTSDGKGYWLAARDGGVFSFGDAQFMGSDFAKLVASGRHPGSSSGESIRGIAPRYYPARPIHRRGHGFAPRTVPTTVRPDDGPDHDDADDGDADHDDAYDGPDHDDAYDGPDHHDPDHHDPDHDDAYDGPDHQDPDHQDPDDHGADNNTATDYGDDGSTDNRPTDNGPTDDGRNRQPAGRRWELHKPRLFEQRGQRNGPHR